MYTQSAILAVFETTYFFLFPGTAVGLNRFKTDSLEDLLEWEFMSKHEFSAKRLNPKYKIMSPLKEGLGDVTREVNFN